MNSKPTVKLSERIPLIGREQELEQLRTYLRAPGSGRHYVYYWAHGGLGKTRLLEELERMVKEAGPRFYFSGIIDLYHTDTHSTSDLERIIVQGLDPKHRYFVGYRKERQTYELLRERGTDPGILEDRRRKLGDLFVQGCNEMALRADKLVICFDTIELLQYESSVLEEKAGVDVADTRVKPWLLEKLAQLSNVLVVFVGRPKHPAPDEQTDPQARLVADMRKAFGDDLAVVELQPFTFEETQKFLKAIEGSADQKRIPGKYVKIVHRLTGGRPIFLHLIVDWLAVLALESRTILQLFDHYMDLADIDENDERLEVARQNIERGILDAVFNASGEIRGYLTNIALMPKGVDADILNVTLGLPLEEASKLMASLEPLSFIKRYKSPPGVASVHGEQLFLHDEVSRLLTSRDVIPYLRMNERRVANTLVQNYYNLRITELEDQLAVGAPEQRLPLREQLQKLQVERVYYLLVVNPRQGYEEYKQLTDVANRRRQVGFSMRLLDEFLHFYYASAPERRKLFEEVGITNEQIVRESAEMWVERFHWWGQRNREVKFARDVLDQPEVFFIDPEKHVAILANICALWARARAMLHEYEPWVVAEASALLDRLPPLADCTPEQALAHARLSTSIGFQLDMGGLLPQAADHYADAKAAFRKFGQCQDELAMLLNNLAYLYAKEGRMALAHPLAHEALRINERMGFEYSTGLTLSTLSSIAWIRGNYGSAIEYGEEALAIFRDLQDAHGMALAYKGIAQARRRMAKRELEKGRKLDEARAQMEEALRELENALVVAEDAGLLSDVRLSRTEQALVNRDLGRLISDTDGPQEGLLYYRQGERQLRQVLNEGELDRVEQANALQDLAEILFNSGDPKGAQECLEQVENLIGSQHRIISGKQKPAHDAPREHFSPLGKVEMLRGQMAFAQGKREDGLQRYVIAYAYFMHFSPEAMELETLVEYVYKCLRDLPVEQQSALMEYLLTWSRQHDLGINVGPFVQTLKDLLGV